jgi:SAM-dependent methyltransferase
VETPSAGETSLGAHDRVKHHLLAPDDPLFTTLGADGDKRRQVDAFLRHLDVLIAAPAARARAEGRALTVVDLGCGNAYLTLAAHHWLSGHAGVNVVRTIGIEMREDVQRRNRDLVARLGLRGVEFVVASISEAEVVGPVDVVLALHACDTATDDALARAVQWRAPVILAAPCCHHDIQRQITEAKTRGEPLPEAYRAVVRSPILRERFCDVLTDALRAHLLEGEGYQVDVVEFIDSKHTPRNALIRARRTGRHPDAAAAAAHAELVHQWRLHPALADRLVAGPPKPAEVGAAAGASVETGVEG